MEKNHALEQAEAQLASIREMVETFTSANETDDADAWENAREAIQQDALDVQVRAGWTSIGNVPENGELTPEQYSILLCTGGPAVRILGRLDENLQPETAQLEYQDWGTPWTRLPLTQEDIDALLAYAGCFYFGE